MNLLRVGCLIVGIQGALAGCQHLNFSRGEAAPEKPPSCLGDGKTLSEQKLNVDGALEDRLKAVWGGVLELEATTKKLEEKLTVTCDALAREVAIKPSEPAPKETPEDEKVASSPVDDGSASAESEEAASSTSPESTSEPSPAELACRKAIAGLQAYKEQTGVSLSIDAKPFSCGARTDDFGTCARKCDPNLPPGKLEIGCDEGKQRGRCSGKCTGQCAEINASDCAATCEGECRGACNKGFYGKCGGKCVGTCDMGNVNGKCDGICDGKCLSDAAGTCEGKCTGKCVGACISDLKAKMCDATCRGECDAPMSGAVCGHVYPPAEMSQECVARCSAEQTSKLVCSVDHVGITVISAKKESDGLKLSNGLRGRLKDVLEIGDGMKTPFDDAAVRVAETLEALNAELENNGDAAKAVGACMSEATERHTTATATFAKFSEISAGLLQAARN